MLGPEILWALATGGSDVAADPDYRPDEAAAGPEPAGVAEACGWMAAALKDRNSAPHMLFLVGGPGGGKSRAAAGVVADLDHTGPSDDGLAQRKYTYTSAGGRALILINDATIQDGDNGGISDRSEIADDIRDALQNKSHLIACVNRGVLVDELSATGEVHEGTEIAQWLAGESITTSTDSTYFLRQSLPTDGTAAPHVTAVYVDVCSLLEDKPVTEQSNGALEPKPYQVKKFLGAQRLSTPAGQLFERVITNLDWQGVAEPQLDPVRANLDSLREPALLNGLLSVLRASEIIAGTRYTYRELWGVLARVVAGELTRTVRANQATAYFALTPQADGVPLSFAQLQRLAEHRWFVSLFGGLEPAPVDASRDPVLRLTSRADPLLDASPEWAGDVSDAFASSALSGSPLSELRRALPDELIGAIQPFDERLDEAFSAYCLDADYRRRADAESWYGAYLTRLYACARGVPAFHDSVNEWVRSYRLSSTVPDEIDPLLHTLLSPRRFASSQSATSLIPLYSSRTDPILGYVEAATLALRSAHFYLETRKDGEDLRLMVKEDGKTVGAILLDFDLVREAMTCSNDWLGMTEASDHVSPRVERFRSRRLKSESIRRKPQIVVAIGEKDFLVTVEAPSA